MHLIRRLLPLVTLLLATATNATEDSDNPIVPTAVQENLPVLQPSESVPVVGTYSLNNKAGKPCLKASMGVEFVVRENKKSSYYNVDPTTTKTTGYCAGSDGVLSLSIAGNGGNLALTFKQEGNVSYVTKVTAFLHPAPACKECIDKTYPGIIDHEKLFKTSSGRSFKCISQTEFHLSDNLKVKIAPLQVQAFKMTSEKFGEEVECWADFNKRVIPIILGATAVGLILIAAITFLIVRDRRRQGYENI